MKRFTKEAAKSVGEATTKAAKGVAEASKTAAKGVTDVSKKAASVTTSFGGSAFKKVYGLIDDDASDSETDDKGPQTEEQEFVSKLYEKVHTQSDMV